MSMTGRIDIGWAPRVVRVGVLCLLVVGGMGLVAPVHGQQARDTTETQIVEILHADSSRGYRIDGARVRTLFGSVRLKQDTTHLRARRVIQHLETDSVHFDGNVRITDEGDTLWADHVDYSRRTKIGEARGNVRLTDGDVVLYAPSARYFVDAKRAHFQEGVRLVDSVSVLTSNTGHYWLDEKRAVFEENVHLDQEDTDLTADSLVHYRERSVSEAYGQVIIKRFETEQQGGNADTLSRTFLFGDKAWHRETDKTSRMSGRPLMVRLTPDSASVDTVLVRASEIWAQQSDTMQKAVAIDSVRLWRRNFAAVADSVVYTKQRRPVNVAGLPDSLGLETIRMYQDPRAWIKQSQISGDTMRVRRWERRTDSLWVWSSAFIAVQDTVVDRINQLKGRRIVGELEEDQLQYLISGPNAEAIRFVVDEDDQVSGAIEMSSDFIESWFEDDRPQRVEATKGIQGTYYPLETIPQPLRLDGFTWTPERRPRKQDFFDVIAQNWRTHPFLARIPDE